MNAFTTTPVPSSRRHSHAPKLTFSSALAPHPVEARRRRRANPEIGSAPATTASSSSSAPATSTSPSPRPRAPRPIKRVKPRILVVGGSGRVGSAVARNLQRLYFDECDIYLAGRTRQKLDRVAKSVGAAATYDLDYTNHAALEDAMRECSADIVVHTAGPFQQLEHNDVLQVALQRHVPYVDVCDDLHLAQHGKKLFSEQAILDGIPCVVSVGAFPGITNLMAAHLIEEGGGARSVDFNYFCAGSGGAGDAVMSATFLLLAESVVSYVNGVAVQAPPYSDRKRVDFGEGVGERSTFLYELPETTQIHGTYKVPNVTARFGTAPEAWNYATKMVAELAPREMLRDRARVLQFVRFINPLIRLVDPFVGTKIAMRVDVEGADGARRRAIYTHEDTVEAAGLGGAAFAAMVLAGRVSPGVHFPEQAVRNATDRQELFDFTKVPGTAGYSFWS
eukprot:tig00021127_g18811.t1